jgi:hypothetical protein
MKCRHDDCDNDLPVIQSGRKRYCSEPCRRGASLARERAAGCPICGAYGSNPHNNWCEKAIGGGF